MLSMKNVTARKESKALFESPSPQPFPGGRGSFGGFIFCTLVAKRRMNLQMTRRGGEAAS
jgi:hypothetical protein